MLAVDTSDDVHLDLLVSGDHTFRPQAMCAAGMPLRALIMGVTFMSNVALRCSH